MELDKELEHSCMERLHPRKSELPNMRRSENNFSGIRCSAVCRGHSVAGALWIQKSWWASEDGSEEWVEVGTEAEGFRPSLHWLVGSWLCFSVPSEGNGNPLRVCLPGNPMVKEGLVGCSPGGVAKEVGHD